jgi:hypothetical protein
VVDALRQIHRWLRPEGVLLDVHPQPVNSAVEVWDNGRVEHLGFLEEEEDNEEILDARVRLSEVEREGWYVTERRRHFDLVSLFPSVEEWQAFQAHEGYASGISDELLKSANLRLAAGGSEFIIREPIRASLLRPIPNPGDDGV